MKLFIDYPPRIDQCVRGRLWKKFHWLPPMHWTMYEISWNFLEFYNISQYFTVFVKGSNLLNNNVNTVSLSRTHRGMQTSSSEIRVQYRPPACGRRSILDPNFSGFRSAFANASSPDSRHCPIVVRCQKSRFICCIEKSYASHLHFMRMSCGSQLQVKR